MGLDQYAWALDKAPDRLVDFNFNSDEALVDDMELEKIFKPDPVFGDLFNTKPGSGVEALAYWRKHPNLHGFIRGIYQRKGGSRFHWNEFSGPVVLDAEDIDAIEKATLSHSLPHTTGFFFGESTPSKDEATLEFCRRARRAIQQGKTVVYDSSW